MKTVICASTNAAAKQNYDSCDFMKTVIHVSTNAAAIQNYDSCDFMKTVIYVSTNAVAMQQCQQQKNHSPHKIIFNHSSDGVICVSTNAVAKQNYDSCDFMKTVIHVSTNAAAIQQCQQQKNHSPHKIIFNHSSDILFNHSPGGVRQKKRITNCLPSVPFFWEERRGEAENKQ
jgi:hypothetical protein